MKHSLSKEKIEFKEKRLDVALNEAENIEKTGNWFIAGEKYHNIAESNKRKPSIYLEVAKTFVRAATCFELAGERRDAARAFFEAASILHNNKINYIAAGELFNRAAFDFKFIAEYFNAGDSYMRAAKAFSDSQIEIIITNDNIPPVPGAAGRFTISGACYETAAEAFSSGDNLAWAQSVYWQAGQMHNKEDSGYHAYSAFRKALVTCIKFYHTLDSSHLRKALPMTKEEREQLTEPIAILEKAAFNGNKSHQQINTHILDNNWIECTTIEQMISSFHEFYLEFNKIGNIKEAKLFYIKEKRKQTELLFKTKKYLPWLGLKIWDLTCEFGESFTRWFITCTAIVFIFGIFYAFLSLIGPVKSWVDYFYFSSVTFTTLGYGDIQPIRIIGKIIASLEAGLGFLMLGVLLTILSRKMSS